MFFKRKIQNLSDDELLSKFRHEGDMVLLGELYNRYGHLVYGVCLKYLKNKEDARDATLSLFEKLAAELKKREVMNLRGWMGVVSKNHCLMVLREKSRYPYREQPLLANELLHDEDSEQREIEKELNLERMEQALDQLNTVQRTCVTMFYLEERSYKEISEHTGFSLQEVKSYIQNGRRNLRMMITKEQ